MAVTVLFLCLFPLFSATLGYDGKGGYAFKSDEFSLSYPNLSLYAKAGCLEMGSAASYALPSLFISPYSNPFRKTLPSLGFERGKNSGLLFSLENFYLLTLKGEREAAALFYDSGPFFFTAALYSKGRSGDVLYERSYEKRKTGFLRLGGEFDGEHIAFFLLLDTAFRYGASLTGGIELRVGEYRFSLIEGTPYSTFSYSGGERRRIAAGLERGGVSLSLEKIYGFDPVFFEEYRPLMIRASAGVRGGNYSLKGENSVSFSKKGKLSKNVKFTLEGKRLGVSYSSVSGFAFKVKAEKLNIQFDGKRMECDVKIKKGRVRFEYEYSPAGKLTAGLFVEL